MKLQLHKKLLPLFLASLLASNALFAVEPEAPPAASRPDVAELRRDKDGKPSAPFVNGHERFLKRGKEGPIGVLFIGDSITAGWLSPGKAVWQEYYSKLEPANFGIGGDRTEGVLWRIENGELDGISPKVVVLLIGVNNGSRPGIAAGITKIVKNIRTKLPNTKVLLLGIFPHGKIDPARPEWHEKSATNLAEVNQEIAKLDDGKTVRFLDIGPKFVNSEGLVTADIMPDLLHPNEKGYKIWAETMQPLLEEMLQSK